MFPLKKVWLLLRFVSDSQPTARTCPIGSTWCQVPCPLKPMFFRFFPWEKKTPFFCGGKFSISPREIIHFFSPHCFLLGKVVSSSHYPRYPRFSTKKHQKVSDSQANPQVYRAENSGQLWCFRWQVFKCHETSGFHRRPLKIRSRMVGVLLVLGLLWLYYWITMGLLKVGKLRTIDYIGLQWISCISSIHCRLVDRKARQLLG